VSELLCITEYSSLIERSKQLAATKLLEQCGHNLLGCSLGGSGQAKCPDKILDADPDFGFLRLEVLLDSGRSVDLRYRYLEDRSCNYACTGPSCLCQIDKSHVLPADFMSICLSPFMPPDSPTVDDSVLFLT
jgi:hypothetical protein